MELWIRSQDKRTLIQTNRIDIDDKSIIVWQNNYNCDETYLGTYGTKERALEVLDEIQDFITTSVHFVRSEYEQADIEVKTKILCNMAKIYTMPEE